MNGSYSTYATFPIMLSFPSVKLVSLIKEHKSDVLPHPTDPTTTRKSYLFNYKSKSFIIGSIYLLTTH